MPDGQAKHSDAPLFEVNPGMHVVQSAEPALEKVPAAQGVHRSPSPLLVPAVQLEQVDAPGGEDRPAVQFEHEVAPSPEKVPAPHWRHCLSSGYRPSSHASHWAPMKVLEHSQEAAPSRNAPQNPFPEQAPASSDFWQDSAFKKRLMDPSPSPMIRS